MARRNGVDEFFKRVSWQLSDSCWLWQGEKTGFGHGRFWTMNRYQMAHRWAWAYWRGPIPGNLLVLHRCDNPGCVNPAHLWLGTNDDNMKDMAAKGRGRGRPPFGELNGSSKLSADDIPVIRQLYACGESQAAIGRRFGVTQTNIGNIVRGKKWKSA